MLRRRARLQWRGALFDICDVVETPVTVDHELDDSEVKQVMSRVRLILVPQP